MPRFSNEAVLQPPPRLLSFKATEVGVLPQCQAIQNHWSAARAVRTLDFVSEHTRRRPVQNPVPFSHFISPVHRTVDLPSCPLHPPGEQLPILTPPRPRVLRVLPSPALLWKEGFHHFTQTHCPLKAPHRRTQLETAPQ